MLRATEPHGSLRGDRLYSFSARSPFARPFWRTPTDNRRECKAPRRGVSARSPSAEEKTMRSTTRRFLAAILLTAAAGFALSQEADTPPAPTAPDVAAPVAELPQLPVVSSVPPVPNPNAPAVDPAVTIDPNVLAIAPATTNTSRVTKSSTKPVARALARSHRILRARNGRSLESPQRVGERGAPKERSAGAGRGEVGDPRDSGGEPLSLEHDPRRVDARRCTDGCALQHHPAPPPTVDPAAAPAGRLEGAGPRAEVDPRDHAPVASKRNIGPTGGLVLARATWLDESRARRVQPPSRPR